MNDRHSRPFNVFEQVEAAKGEMMQARVHLERGWTDYADQCLEEVVGRLERVLAHLGVSDGRRVPRRIVIPFDFTEDDFAAMGVSRDQWYALSRAEQQELVDRTWNQPRQEEVERLYDATPERIEQARADIAAGRTIPLSELEQRRRVDDR